MKFTHLHVHTEYSLLDGSSKINELIDRTKELGMDSIAITDHGVMYGVIDFYKVAKARGVKPIIGCEVYVAPNSRFEKDSTADDRYFHLVLLAENNVGYSNLMKIVSRGFTEGFYYKPRVDYEVLRIYSEGIIALSGCLGGEVATYLRRGLYEESKKAALRLIDIFGKDNFFLELQDHGMSEQKNVNQGLLKISKEINTQLVATNDSHYTYKEDEQAHDILLCIQTAKKLEDENRMRYEGGQFYLKSPEEMIQLFPYAKEAIENTEKIANRCNVDIVFGEPKLPLYNVPHGYTGTEYLREVCNKGLDERYPDDNLDGIHSRDNLTQRLNYELSVIEQMGYVDYFLIVWDFIKYARDNGIKVGPGRGSAAGSIVSYCLRITDIDPIKYNLLFERFLNPERISMPDIDIDFCYERRQEVIDYVVKKYGKDRVVQIITFGTMGARAVIRDVGRTMSSLSYALVDSVAKMIPFEIGITINKALELNPELLALYNNDNQVKFLIDMSMRLEGLPRHTSVHAAGVVISQLPVEEYVPLSCSSDDSITTQFPMTTLEELGLLKMDFLGLRTLTVIQNAIRLVGKSKQIEIDIDNIDYDDKAVFNLITSSKTEGIFQLESSGMKSFMKELKPQCLEDIIAGISLYRPGPMDFIPKYVKGKNNISKVKYDCPQLESILESTYGCIVYQEQVMQIVRELAGYTYGRSDLVRRAMSKKKSDVMKKERENFVYGNQEEGVPGCINNGISEAVANHIFDEMTDFAKYAFNKSHAAAYAVVSYQTAYLKYYYPIEFMAALMTSVIDNSNKVSEYILTCRQMGIEILPPDINEGESSFSVIDNSIRYGLSAIKSLGKPVIDAIVSERELNGRYTGFKDFATRLSGKEVNKRTVENFIKAGAMDSLSGNRQQQMLTYTEMIDVISRDKKNNIEGQMSLFDFTKEDEKEEYEINLPDIVEYDKERLLSFEKEVLGIYISGHPLDEYRSLWEKNITKTTMDFVLDEESNQPKINDGESAIIGGMVVSKTIKNTRNNKVMAFIIIEDLVGTVEIILFPNDFERFKNELIIDRKLFIKGRATVEEDKPAKLICEKVIAFDNIPREIWVQFNNIAEFNENEQKLYDILNDYDGNDSIVIYCKDEKAKKYLPPSRNVSAKNELLLKLKESFSVENVKLVEKSIENTSKKG